MPEATFPIKLAERMHYEGKRFLEKDTKTFNPIDGSDIDRPWYYYERLYTGWQYDLFSQQAAWASRPYKNIIFMGVETYTTLLTDSRPSFSVIPREEGDEELAAIVKAAVEHWWDREDMDGKTALAVKSSRIYGIGWLYTYYDPDTRKICVKVVHPGSVRVDSDCTVEDYDPTWVEYEFRCQFGELQQKYPDAKKYGVDWNRFDTGWTMGMRTDEAASERYDDNSNPAISVAVYQYWMKDTKRITWDEEIGDKTVTKSKPKYPGGRIVTVAGGKVIDDRPYKAAHKQCPFTPIHAYPVPGRFYGIGDVQNLMNLQLTRNRMTQFISDATYRSGGGYILVGQNSGIDAGKITNAPVQVVPCRDVTQFRVERAPAPSRHVFDYINMLDYDAQDVLGSHDISQGRRSPGNPVTAQEVAVLSESDRTRVRMASRWLTWALRRVGGQALSLMAQYPDFKWMLRVSGESVPMDNDDGEEMQESRVVEFDGKMLKSKFTEEAVNMDLVIADTSTLPASQQQQVNQVGMLLQWGVITPQDVLKYNLVEIPHAEQILADQQKAQEQAAMQPQLPAGATPPPEMGAPNMEAAMAPPAAPAGEGDMAAMIEEVASEFGIDPAELAASLGM